jgi:hypothetical protein
MESTPTTTRLPLLGEAARPAERGVLAAGQAPDAAAAAPKPVEVAPIVVLHGVGEFAPGDVIGVIAQQPQFSRVENFRRESVFARQYRYSLLMEGHAGDGRANRVRLLEVNWSDVRRAMPNLAGLMRNFVTLLMALNRIGVDGAYRSRSLSQKLVTGGATLWLIESLLVWVSLAPALSALLWQLRPGERVAAGVLVAGASLYIAMLVRHLSVPLAVGGGVFALLAAAAGGWSCFVPGGHAAFAAFAAQLHTWATLLACSAVLVSTVEIALRRCPAGAEGEARWVHRLSRMACLWLPMVMIVLMQPLTVSALLLPMGDEGRSTWGVAFARQMPFDPHDAQSAAGLVAIALSGTLLLGALQFKLVQRHGRNVTVMLGWGSGLALLAAARLLEFTGFDHCELCQKCLRTDWLASAGLMLTLGASITWVLFARSDLARDPAGRTWYPAGAFARFWAGFMLVAMPLVLASTLGWLWWMAWSSGGPLEGANASDVFIESTKYALLLAPLASRPFAAFLDALGDVFFFLVPQRNLSTRLDTQPRLWQALRHLDPAINGRHIIVFAHSQGTVIAAGLLSRMVRFLRVADLRLTLVTVGSPLTTLYRNFLGADIGAAFGSLCEQQPGRFRWFNLYRPADYIGGEVELDGVVNRDLLTPGDHVGYWSDRELLKWLKALSEDRAA